MASSVNLQSLESFKCVFCTRIPSEASIKKCLNGHIVCLKCASQNARCKCSFCVLIPLMPNPLMQIVQTTNGSNETKKECPYKDKGCTWLISQSNDSTDHCSECKFRPYKCAGAHLGIWNCNWTGIQQDFGEHMKTAHADNGPFFEHWYSGKLDFDPNVDCKKFNLINAFNKKFAFVFMSRAANANVIFVIYLLGRKADAQKYMIDFELKNDLRKVKFIETCFSDADDIADIVLNHRCVILPKTLVATYAKEGQLEFRFFIKKKENIESENVEKQQHLLSNVYRQTNDTPTPHFAAKTQMKAYQSESNLALNADRPQGGSSERWISRKTENSQNSKIIPTAKNKRYYIKK